jgi:hypothetical protein
MWWELVPLAYPTEDIEGQLMKVAVLLQPIGRVEEVDSSDHGTEQARVGRGDLVDHCSQEQGQAGGQVSDVDRLTGPKTSPVPVFVRDRLVAPLEILADRLVEPPGELAVVGRDSEEVGQRERVLKRERGAEGHGWVRVAEGVADRLETGRDRAGDGHVAPDGVGHLAHPQDRRERQGGVLIDPLRDTGKEPRHSHEGIGLPEATEAPVPRRRHDA